MVAQPTRSIELSTNLMLEVRGEEYGNAWFLTGWIIERLGADKLSTLIFSGFSFAWIQILNKLVRLLRNPYHKDSWIDIIGYATLVVRDIEAKPGEADSDV